MEPSKKDWKLFRDKIGSWQEAYMERLIREYMDYLSSDEPASTKFWEMEKKIKRDKKKPGVMIELRKGNMAFDMLHLIKDGVISMDDLTEFSDEWKEYLRELMERHGL